MMFDKVESPWCCSTVIHKAAEGKTVKTHECGVQFLPPTLERQKYEIRRCKPDTNMELCKTGFRERAASDGLI